MADYQTDSYLRHSTTYEGWQRDYRNFVERNSHVRFNRCLLGRGDEDIVPSNYFDVVCSVSVIENIHEKNWANLFQAAYRILKPGGAFINTTDITFYDAGKAERLAAEQQRVGLGFEGDPKSVFKDAHPSRSLIEHPAVTAFIYNKFDQSGQFYGHETTILSVATKG
ncbi:class I SAM-dependent methyltransferase [Falsiroseomonas sp. HC035]|uniref:class I SAM-dependent methyltransferase n=1 Tax=Falsiroseomonas sp. HC035 TaxID=3390999 RepID=UPI003D31DB05